MKRKVKILKQCGNEEHRLFIEHLKALKYSYMSLRLYSYCLDQFDSHTKAAGVSDHAQITKQLILDYLKNLKGRGFSEASRGIYYRPLLRFFAYLEERQKIFLNPTMGISLITPCKLPVVASESEISKMLEAPDTEKPKGLRDKAFLELLYSTGMRREEIISLNLSDINMDEATVRVVGKGEKERILPIGKSALHWLAKYIKTARVELMEEAESKALWVKHGGGRIGYDFVQAMINQCRDKAGIKRKLACHDFRRAFATHMLQRGASPVDVQHLLGHADFSHLRKYLRLTIADLKNVHSESRVSQ